MRGRLKRTKRKHRPQQQRDPHYFTAAGPLTIKRSDGSSETLGPTRQPSSSAYRRRVGGSPRRIGSGSCAATVDGVGTAAASRGRSRSTTWLRSRWAAATGSPTLSRRATGVTDTRVPTSGRPGRFARPELVGRAFDTFERGVRRATHTCAAVSVKCAEWDCTAPAMRGSDLCFSHDRLRTVRESGVSVPPPRSQSATRKRPRRALRDMPSARP